MACLNDTRLQEYIDGSLTTVERAIVRDHLIVCADCRERHQSYEQLERNLLEPVEITPPDIIRRNVMKTLFPVLPSYASIFTAIAASFLMLVTGIYVYFDFANNSIIQAFQLTSSTTTNWLGSILKSISTIFSAVYAVFKAINKFTSILLKVDIGVEIIGLSALVLLMFGFYWVSNMMFKKMKGNTH